MRSDYEKGSRAPHRSLLKALGITDSKWNGRLSRWSARKATIYPATPTLIKSQGRWKTDSQRGRSTVHLQYNRGVRRRDEPQGDEIFPLLPRADCRLNRSYATAHPMDAAVFIPNCDKIVPGMLMAACRVNIPRFSSAAGRCSWSTRRPQAQPHRYV